MSKIIFLWIILYELYVALHFPVSLFLDWHKIRETKCMLDQEVFVMIDMAFDEFDVVWSSHILGVAYQAV